MVWCRISESNNNNYSFGFQRGLCVGLQAPRCSSGWPLFLLFLFSLSPVHTYKCLASEAVFVECKQTRWGARSSLNERGGAQQASKRAEAPVDTREWNKTPSRRGGNLTPVCSAGLMCLNCSVERIYFCFCILMNIFCSCLTEGFILRRVSSVCFSLSGWPGHMKGKLEFNNTSYKVGTSTQQLFCI